MSPNTKFPTTKKKKKKKLNFSLTENINGVGKVLMMKVKGGNIVMRGGYIYIY